MFRLSRTVHWSSRPGGCFCLQCGDRQPAEGRFFLVFAEFGNKCATVLTHIFFVMIGDGLHPLLLVVYIPTVRIPYESREGHSPYSDFWLYLDYKSNDFDRCVSFIEVIFDALVGGHEVTNLFKSSQNSPSQKGQLLKNKSWPIKMPSKSGQVYIISLISSSFRSCLNRKNFGMWPPTTSGKSVTPSWNLMQFVAWLTPCKVS